MRLLPVVCCLLISPLISRAEREPAHKLTYKTDGNDLIVSTSILIPGGPHLLFTSFDNTEARTPGLRYTIIRNSDDLYESAKFVTIEWRLRDYKTELLPSRVTGQMIALSTAELKPVGGKALELVKE